jgi:hypothetical protein
MIGVHMCNVNGTPMLNGQKGLKYEMQSIRMKSFLHAHGYDVCHSVVTGHTATKKPPNTIAKKELKRNNKIECILS